MEIKDSSPSKIRHTGTISTYKIPGDSLGNAVREHVEGTKTTKRGGPVKRKGKALVVESGK